LKIIRSDLNQSFILFWDLIEMLSLNSAAIGLLGALKGKGLNLSRYEYLKGLDYQGIVNFMRDNFILVEYRDKLEKGVESLEYFIRLSYLRSCSKFLRFLRGVQWEFIKTFLREYDVYNLKVIIRTIILGGLYPQRLYLFPFSLFYPQVPKFTTLEEVLKFLRREREYKKMVECGYQEYKRRGEYFYLELRMDKMWLSLLRDNSRRLDKRIFVKMEKWLAMIYIFWAVRLYHIQKRDKEDVLAVIDLDNPYLNTALNHLFIFSFSPQKFKNLLQCSKLRNLRIKQEGIKQAEGVLSQVQKEVEDYRKEKQTELEENIANLKQELEANFKLRVEKIRGVFENNKERLKSIIYSILGFN